MPIFVGSAVPNWLKVTTKAHDCASMPSSAQGVHAIFLGCAQARPIEPRRPSGCRLDAGPSTSHCDARRCKVGASWPRGPEPAHGNALSGGPGSTYQFGERQCPTILAANAARSVVHRAAHQSLARCMHTNRKSHAGRRPAGLDIYLFTWHRKTIVSSCACCCCSAVLTYDSGRGFTS